MTRRAWARQLLLRSANGAPKPLPLLRSALRQGPPAKLTRCIGAHLTEDQFEAVDAYARDCGLTLADFLRQLVLGFRPIARRPVARSAIVAVNRASAALNQLVQSGNSRTLLTQDLMLAVAAVLAAPLRTGWFPAPGLAVAQGRLRIDQAAPTPKVPR